MPGADPAAAYLLALALALIFGASGALKLRDPELFAGALANYRLVPRWLETPIAWAIPIAESAAAAGLLFDASRAIAAAALVMLLAVFSGAIAINLVRGRVHIDCGCFGPALRQELSGWLLVRNAVLMIAAAVAAMPISARRLEWLDAITIVLGAATLTVLYVSANYALGNAPRTRALEAL
jgi:hypothetical protein